MRFNKSLIVLLKEKILLVIKNLKKHSNGNCLLALIGKLAALDKLEIGCSKMVYPLRLLLNYS